MKPLKSEQTAESAHSHTHATGDLGHLGVGIVGNGLDSLIYSRGNNVGQSLDIIGIDDVGADVDGKDLALSVDLNGNGSAACLDLVFLLFISSCLILYALR